jgi:hypothetical protein
MNTLQQHRTRGEHIRALDRATATRSKFDKALLAYLGLRPRSGADGLQDGRRARMILALDNRATWNQIKDWRRGWRRAPQWSLDLLARKIDERIAELLKSKTASD